jgi:hypothetical protein
MRVYAGIAVRVIIANPIDVAAADQAAAALGARVELSHLVAAGSAYVVDHQMLYDDLVEDARRELGDTA